MRTTQFMKTEITLPLTRAAVLALLLLLGSQAARAQDLPFTSASTGADGPLAFRSIPLQGRYDHAMAFDPVRQRVVLFGGYGGTYLSDTWLWDGTNWTQVFPPNSPSRRSSHRMVYDAERQEVILFGGYGYTNLTTITYLNDTWAWNGTNWIERTVASPPAARRYHSLAYAAAQKYTLLFGGYGAATFNDTWSWNGTNWTQLGPVTMPSARYGSTLA
jgi:hypothetical protein